MNAYESIDISNHQQLIAMFEACEKECREKLIPWLQMHGPQKKNGHCVKNEILAKVKIAELITLFDGLPCWERSAQATGHCKFKHRITKITISFQGHTGEKNTSFIPENHAKGILEAIQSHVNQLGNKFFQADWSKNFNHKAAAQRYLQQQKIGQNNK